LADSARPQTAAQPAGEAANAASTLSAKVSPAAELAQVLAVQVRVAAAGLISKGILAYINAVASRRPAMIAALFAKSIHRCRPVQGVG
jgi:hypothetical protein